MLLVCTDDGTVLLLKRSQEVEDPGTWGNAGGALGEGFYSSDDTSEDPPDADFYQTAVKEAFEELSIVPQSGQLLAITAFRDGHFTYKTFVYDVSLAEKNRISKGIRLNWENDSWEWFGFKNMPGNLHPGVVFSLGELTKQVPAAPEEAPDEEQS